MVLCVAMCLKKHELNMKLSIFYKVFLLLNDLLNGMPSKKNHKSKLPYFFFFSNLSFGEDISVQVCRCSTWYRY